MSLRRVGLSFAIVSVVVAGVTGLIDAALGDSLSRIGLAPSTAAALLSVGTLILVAFPLTWLLVIRPFASARQTAEETLREAIESISEGFLMYDADDRLVLCNSRFRELYAVAADDFVIGETFENILRTAAERGQYPEAAGRVDAWVDQRLRQHRELAGPIERRLPHGRWVKITERRTRSGNIVGIRTDITDLKAREAEFRESEQRLRRIVDALQEGFVLYDAEDRLVMWNDKWLELHRGIADIVAPGVPFETTIRASVERRLYPAAYGCEEAFLADRLEKHRNPGEPFVRQQRDGRWFIIREVPTQDGGIFALNIDITELKNAERIAHEARVEAERASRTKSAFLANMSHEFRTPLNAIIGFSEVIGRETFGPVGNATYRQYALDIHESGRHLLALINDLLDLSKVESGVDELFEEDLDVSRLFAAAARFVLPLARQKRLALELKVPEAAPALRADDRKVTQVLVNLVTNAVKFTPDGGRVAVTASWAGDSGYAIEIADNGIGIAPEDLPHVILPFNQISNVANRRYAGTGLGLPLSKVLVEQHGGTFEIRSEPGKGTVVTARFPAERIVAPALSKPGAE